MKRIFLTRKQYDKLCGMWKPNSEEQRAYLFAEKRVWSIAGVSFLSDNPKLLEMIAKLKEVLPG